MSPDTEFAFLVADLDDAIHLARRLADSSYREIRVEPAGETGWSVRARPGSRDHDSPAADSERGTWADEVGGTVESSRDPEDPVSD